MRENAQAKGRRYVSEGRLYVAEVTAAKVSATCRGQGEVYRLGYDEGGWWCECPALTTCCHLVALMLVTIRPRAEVGS